MVATGFGAPGEVIGAGEEPGVSRGHGIWRDTILDGRPTFEHRGDAPPLRLLDSAPLSITDPRRPLLLQLRRSPPFENAHIDSA